MIFTERRSVVLTIHHNTISTFLTLDTFCASSAVITRVSVVEHSVERLFA